MLMCQQAKSNFCIVHCITPVCYHYYAAAYLMSSWMIQKGGDYDYCRVSGTRQLSPLEVGEDNSNFKPEKLRKFRFHRYCQTKGCYRGF